LFVWGGLWLGVVVENYDLAQLLFRRPNQASKPSFNRKDASF
jgi:hypothetical protein